MARRTKKTPGNIRARLGLHAVEEWVGGFATMSGYVMEDEPYRPVVAAWLDVTHDLVVAVDVLEPDPPVRVLVDLLDQATKQPMAGPPRRPTMARVEAPAVAAALRPAFPDLQINVGPLPELEELVRTMSAELGHDLDDASYFEDGKVSAPAIGEFFAAAAALWRVAPWELVDDRETLWLDCPDLNARRKCISVVGALGESLGLLVFDSASGYFALAAHEGHPPTDEETLDLGTSLFSINFDPAHVLPDRMRHEAATQGWEVADPEAYPNILWIEADGLRRPLRDEEVRLATLYCLAVARFFAARGPEIDEGAFTAARERFDVAIGDRTARVTVMAPHPEMPWDPWDDEEELDLAEAVEAEHQAALAAGHAVLSRFLASGAVRRRPESWRTAAALVCEALYDYRIRFLDKPSGPWTAVIVEGFMLDFFPAKIAAATDFVEITPDVLTAFFDWLEAQGDVKPRAANAIRKRIAAKTKRFFREVNDPGHFGPAKALALALQEQGIDPTDEVQLQRLIQHQILGSGRIDGEAGPGGRGRKK